MSTRTAPAIVSESHAFSGPGRHQQNTAHARRHHQMLLDAAGQRKAGEREQDLSRAQACCSRSAPRNKTTPHVWSAIPSMSGRTSTIRPPYTGVAAARSTAHQPAIRGALGSEPEKRPGERRHPSDQRDRPARDECGRFGTNACAGQRPRTNRRQAVIKRRMDQNQRIAAAKRTIKLAAAHGVSCLATASNKRRLARLDVVRSRAMSSHGMSVQAAERQGRGDHARPQGPESSPSRHAEPIQHDGENRRRASATITPGIRLSFR